ncbi:hypothetical protein C0J52_13987 [Blattella germanica]|nr:hypothetical protein C0J52_13987 [Blattella germanica]
MITDSKLRYCINTVYYHCLQAEWSPTFSLNMAQCSAGRFIDAGQRDRNGQTPITTSTSNLHDTKRILWRGSGKGEFLRCTGVLSLTLLVPQHLPRCRGT